MKKDCSCSHRIRCICRSGLVAADLPAHGDVFGAPSDGCSYDWTGLLRRRKWCWGIEPQLLGLVMQLARSLLTVCSRPIRRPYRWPLGYRWQPAVCFRFGARAMGESQ